MCSCHSILECCVMFSGVKLSIRSFVLLHCIGNILSHSSGKCRDALTMAALSFTSGCS